MSSDRLVDLVNEGVDLDIRVGDDIAPNLIARQLAANHRVLCAFAAVPCPPCAAETAGAIWPRYPAPVIKERDHPFGVWQLHSKEGQHAIKVTGPLSSNHGEIVHQWCLWTGRGLRSVRGGTSGRISPADIWCRCCRTTGSRPTPGRFTSPRLATSAKIRTTVEFLRHYFQLHYLQHEPTASAVGRGD